MFTVNTGKSTIVKRSSLIFVFCIAFSVLTGVNAFAQHYLNNGVRDNLNHKEKTALVHEESRHLNGYEVENRVKYLAKVSGYRNSDIKGRGSVRGRGNLSDADKRQLEHEEYKLRD
jgi:hypothetical protein